MRTLFPTENTDNNDKYSKDTLSSHDTSKSSANLWGRIKEKLSTLLDAKSYQDWIEPLKIKAISEEEIIIILPNLVFYQGILDNYLEKFEYCKTILGIDLLFRFEIAGTEPENEYVSNKIKDNSCREIEELKQQTETNFFSKDYSNIDYNKEENNSPSSSPVSKALSNHSHLNREYIFRNFVDGPSNQFAHASCLAVADNPGQTYNPLFLYGSTGLGKTHLLHAVGNHVLATRPDTVVTYISSERFMNEMIYCLRFHKMWDFRRKYRNCDVLLVDDIQFIAGKERTQEEFFHTFNALYEAKKQIVVTSDVFPQDIPDIEDRLRNRFQWGLIADIQPPDVEHRIAILMNKAEKLGIYLNNEVAQYIANQAKGSVRVLEGALRRVAAFATLQGAPLDIQLASEVLQNVLGDTPKKLSIDLIQKVVSDHFKLRVSDLKSKKRQRAFSLPRQIAMYLARTRTNASFPEIGAKFGNKDHTTVMHAVRKIEKTKANDLDLKTNIEGLERKLDQQC